MAERATGFLNRSGWSFCDVKLIYQAVPLLRGDVLTANAFATATLYRNKRVDP